ncbi:short-chain dehydrogenase [Drechmeria coniospora]|uniref:Short-chain dehydrogenase n=1 Tax=Drechmeria coniospora TaxID=98403 RepID=A0A151GPG2_DRECN|nr:short-chain dehydrogenase [Drechmeria coniospora]KYK59004.1 short-chain dehydrogenase [Drechmeria coniospora]ODA76506.1 hypothetical protein RJ55_07776 [Drechmeria coniospora]
MGVFIVTGASKGLGAAVTDELLAQGHRVVVAARSKEPLEAFKAAHPGRVVYVVGDMTDDATPTKLVSLAVAFGGLDGVVINHGCLDAQTIEGSTMQGWKKVFDTNVFSCVAMAKAAMAELRKSHGCIVWISSGAASKPYMAWGPYGSSKAALNAISNHVAVEEADVTSITISPGRIDTDMQAELRASGKDIMDEAQYQSFVDAFEQGTLLAPKEPGGVIARFVARPDKSLSGRNLTWNSPELAAYKTSD